MPVEVVGPIVGAFVGFILNTVGNRLLNASRTTNSNNADHFRDPVTKVPQRVRSVSDERSDVVSRYSLSSTSGVSSLHSLSSSTSGVSSLHSLSSTKSHPSSSYSRGSSDPSSSWMSFQPFSSVQASQPRMIQGMSYSQQPPNSLSTTDIAQYSSQHLPNHRSGSWLHQISSRTTRGTTDHSLSCSFRNEFTPSSPNLISSSQHLPNHLSGSWLRQISSRTTSGTADHSLPYSFRNEFTPSSPTLISRSQHLPNHLSGSWLRQIITNSSSQRNMAPVQQYSSVALPSTNWWYGNSSVGLQSTGSDHYSSMAAHLAIYWWNLLTQPPLILKV